MTSETTKDATLFNRDVRGRASSLASRVRRFWLLGLITAVLCGVGSVTLLPKVVKPVYRSEAVLLYREGIQAALNRPGDPVESTRKLGPRLKDMLLARTRLQKVVEELNLYPGIVESEGTLEAVEELRKHIDFKAKEGDTFHIQYDGEDPATAYAVVSRLADGLVDENAQLRSEQAGATKQFLEAEKKRNDEELQVREQALAKFLSTHPEFADEAGGRGGPTTGASVRAQEKKELLAKQGAVPGVVSHVPQNPLLVLERQAARLRERLRNPGAPAPAPVARPAAPVDPKLTQAKNEAENQLGAAQKELSDKLARFTEQHPDVAAARGKLATAQARVQQAEAAIADAQRQQQQPEPEPTYDNPEAEKAALEAQLSKVEKEMGWLRAVQKSATPGQPAPSGPDAAASAIVAMETDWSRLNRDVIESRERGQSLQDKLFRASMAASMETSGGSAQMKVVDPAYRPTRPFSFGKMRVMAAGLGISILLGLVAALLRALFDDRIYHRTDVQRLGLSKLVVFVPNLNPEGVSRG
jgi:uncharacterized protein involved in exopolysaccharide biosynthesis